MVVWSDDISIPTPSLSLGGHLEEFESHTRFPWLNMYVLTVSRCLYVCCMVGVPAASVATMMGSSVVSVATRFW